MLGSTLVRDPTFAECVAAETRTWPGLADFVLLPKQLSEAAGAETAAFQVGYERSSRFSRKYSRIVRQVTFGETWSPCGGQVKHPIRATPTAELGATFHTQ